MMTGTAELDYLMKQAKSNMEEMRQIRKDLANMMILLNANHEMARRHERRQGELRDDLEVIIKMEIGGALANVQTTIENSLSRIEEAVENVTNRIETVENRF